MQCRIAYSGDAKAGSIDVHRWLSGELSLNSQNVELVHLKFPQFSVYLLQEVGISAGIQVPTEQ